jgi:uncharacterized damage-inducible protein DinB
MVEVRALIEYNAEVRQRYFDALAKLPWDEFVKDREASWHSVRNIFVHTLNAVNYWLDFLQGKKADAHRDLDAYNTLDDVQGLMRSVETRMQEFLNSLTPDQLAKKYTVTDDLGRTTQVTTEDVLVHVFEEEVHHRGELIGLLWQMNIEPPSMGWKYL